MMKASFRDAGQAKLDRLDQDETQAACCRTRRKPPSPRTSPRSIEAAQLDDRSSGPPTASYLGDWKDGEKIAQSGRGMTVDRRRRRRPNGGNCYNCHQITKEEISYGTIGPSLYNYGKMRGVTDPATPTAQPIVEYTWGKI